MTAAEIFGKVMSISDDLMWRYYELLTDVPSAELKKLQESARSGELNPRDLKADLAKRIIADFHSVEAASAAEEEFVRIFRRKEAPEEVEEHTVAFASWELKQLLVELKLASSKADARRLIEQGGVYLDGIRCDAKTNYTLQLMPSKPGYDIKVGKRRFVRVRGE
jgi:tyrosyl-tRNA synthetase